MSETVRNRRAARPPAGRPRTRVKLTKLQLNKVAHIVRLKMQAKVPFRAHDIAAVVANVDDIRKLHGDDLFAGLRDRGLFQCVGCQCWKETKDEAADGEEVCHGCGPRELGGEG